MGLFKTKAEKALQAAQNMPTAESLKRVRSLAHLNIDQGGTLSAIDAAPQLSESKSLQLHTLAIRAQNGIISWETYETEKAKILGQ